MGPSGMAHSFVGFSSYWNENKWKHLWWRMCTEAQTKADCMPMTRSDQIRDKLKEKKVVVNLEANRNDLGDSCNWVWALPPVKRICGNWNTYLEKWGLELLVLLRMMHLLQVAHWNAFLVISSFWTGLHLTQLTIHTKLALSFQMLPWRQRSRICLLLVPHVILISQK